MNSAYARQQVPTRRGFVLSRPRPGRTTLLILVLVAAFGPYLYKAAGIRTDHLIVYGVAGWALLQIAAGSSGWRLPVTLWTVIACLASATFWTLAISILLNSASAMETIAGLENYVQPMGLVVGLSVVVALAPLEERRRLLGKASAIICLLLGVNTLVGVASVFWNTWPLVEPFVRATSTGASVWQNAATLGRYSGIFDQPMEAGAAYATGLAAWVYWVEKSGRPTAGQLVLLGALMVGGFLSVSKVFILGGLPLFCAYLAWSLRWRPGLLARYLLAALVSLPFAVWLMSRWVGERFLLRIFDIDVIASQGLIALYTSGRFGGAGQTTVEYLFATAWSHAPLRGFGFGAFSPLDGAYIQYFYQGGLIALLIYAFMLAALGLHVLAHYHMAPREARLLLILLVLVVGAGLGAPVLTLNRSSILLWVLIVLAVSASAGRRSAADHGIRAVVAPKHRVSRALPLSNHQAMNGGC